jgi:hypothetical protein
MSDIVHPSHYNAGKIEVWDFTTDWNMDFLLGNVIKYVCRAGLKEGVNPLKDLRKAEQYLAKKIKVIELDMATVVAVSDQQGGDEPDEKPEQPPITPDVKAAVTAVVVGTAIAATTRAEVHTQLKARREELPLANQEIAERLGTNAKRLRNIFGRPELYKIETLQGMIAQLEGLQEGLTDGELLILANNRTPEPPTKEDWRQEREAATVKPEPVAKPKPRILPDPGRVVDPDHKEKPGPKPGTTPTPTPKQITPVDWMDAPLSEIASGKRQYPGGYSLIRHCIGGDVDSNVWECVPSDQPLKHHEIAYLRFTRAAEMWVCNLPTVIALAHRDAANDLWRAVTGKSNR